MVTKAETVWFDGELVNWDDATVHVLTHTLHYGLGVFEGIRSYRRSDGRSAIFRLREHIERLVKGARMMTIPLDYSVDELMDACVKTAKLNRLDGCVEGGDGAYQASRLRVLSGGLLDVTHLLGSASQAGELIDTPHSVADLEVFPSAGGGVAAAQHVP